MKTRIKKPVMLVIALIVILAMLRLGFWQLDRAAQKQSILDAQRSLATSQPIALTKQTLLKRFQPIKVRGTFDPSKTIFLDNQVHQSRVGYHVLTAFQLEEDQSWILVNRGWTEKTPNGIQPATMKPESRSRWLTGRLNLPAAQPPLWRDSDQVNHGAVWQFLPIESVSDYLQVELSPMVVELDPINEATQSSDLIRAWQKLDDKWVSRHKAYAVQWFAMAAAFFIACVVLLIRSLGSPAKRK